MATREFRASELPTYQDHLARDTRRVPDTYRFENRVDYGSDEFSLTRYTSPEQHALEVEKMWKRAWQLAGFEIDLPKVGSYFTYEIAGISIIVTRSGEHELSAFYNSCRHRAAALCKAGSGDTKHFVCPYHGWTYKLDGTLSFLPSRWDFPNVTPGTDRIAPVKVATFNGLIFVSLDPNAPSLLDYLAPFPEHFAPIPPFKGARKRTAWIRKIVPVNWKAAQEAFMEGYHLPTTHPELAPGAPGYEMDYAILGPHIVRLISSSAAPTWQTGPAIPEQEILDRMTTATGMPRIPVADGQTARAALADFMRGAMRQALGLDLSAASDAEVVDSPLNYVFPNIVIWGGYAVPWIYRFRPNGDDPRSAIMEIIQMTPVPEAAAIDHAPRRDLGPDEPFSAAPEIGYLGPVLDQDLNNMQMQQIGFRSSPDGVVRPSRHQEALLRHHAQILDGYLKA